MAKVIAFEVQVGGVQKAITNEKELAEAVKLVNDAYKKADYGSANRDELQKSLGRLKALQAENTQEVRKAGREYQISADKGKGSYRALNAELVNLRSTYKELSAAERNVVGPDLLKRIDKLDTELKDIDASMGLHQRNVGNYTSAFAQLGGIDLESFATVPGAILAVGTAAVAGAKALFEMTEEIRVLRGQIENLTGEGGAQLDSFTSRIIGIADTFGESQTEILNAANAVSKQLGISFEDSLGRIEEGFIAGSNQTGEFLQNLREYPTFFQEAGLSADAFFRVINQQSTQGLYSDKGVDAVKEVTLRLREMVPTTQAALEGLGLGSTDIVKQIEEEGIGAAIATVAKRLGEMRADSPEVGAALADIFAGAGEDAGLDFLVSLQHINDETGSLIDTTSEYQKQQQETLRINQEFAAIQNDIARELAGTGVSFENLGTQIQTKALQFLLFFIEQLKNMLSVFAPVRDAFLAFAEQLGLVDSAGRATETAVRLLNAAIEVAAVPAKLLATALTGVFNALSTIVDKGREFLEFLGIIDADTKKAATSAGQMSGSMGRLGGSVQRVSEETKKADEETKKLNTTLAKTKDATNKAAVATDAFAKDSIAALRAEVAKLKKDLDTIAPEGQEGVLSRLIDAEAAVEKAEAATEKLRRTITDTLNKPLPELDLLSTLGGVDPGPVAEDAAAKIIDINRKKNEVLLQQEQERAAATAEIQETIFQSLQSGIAAVGLASQARTEGEVTALEARYQREIDLAEGNADKQEQLRADLDKARARIEKQEFERQKRYRIAAALTSLAEGTVNILASPTVIPDPFGTAFKVFRIAVLAGTTAAQIAAINKQAAARGTLIEKMTGNPRRGFVPTISSILAGGGIVDGVARGASHSDPSGGIPVRLNGIPVVIENGEAVDVDEFGAVAVLNKRSTAANRAFLRGISGKQFPGKRALLSAINSQHSYGVKFAEGGLIPDASNFVLSGNSGGSSPLGPVTISEESIAVMANETARAVYQGAKEGLAEGAQESVRFSERQARLADRTGIQ